MVQYLWPREALYLYAYNEGSTPQDMIISFSAANCLTASVLAALLSAMLLY